MCNNCANVMENKEYINYQTSEKLELERVSTLPNNAILKVRMDLWNEWDFKKNDELGLDIWKVTKGNSKYAWWECPKCNKPYFAQIKSRASRGTNCRDCSYLNNYLNFNKGKPETMNKTSSEMTSMLKDISLATKLYKTSKVYVDWKCPDCGETIKDKTPASVNYNGLNCPNCSDSISIGEKILYNILKLLDVNFTYQKSFDWLKNRFYDFYIPHLNTIIEVHGKQHYIEDSFNFELSLSDRQSIDNLKMTSAMDNGISKYITIDASDSSFNFIFNNITDSDLYNLIPLNTIDKSKLINSINKKMNVEILKLWNEGMSVKEISNDVLVGTKTVSRVLKNYHQIGACTYDPYRGVKKNSQSKRRKIYQYDNSYTLVNIYDDYIVMHGSSEFNISSVGTAIKNSNKYKGFYWSYYPLNEEEKNNAI